MQITPQLFLFVLLLLPGLLGYELYCALANTEKPTWPGRSVAAIILCAAAYLSMALLRQWAWLDWLPDPLVVAVASEKGLVGGVGLEVAEAVFAGCVFSVAFSLGWSVIHSHRTLHRLSAFIGLTTRSGYGQTWDSVMICQARKRWVTLAMKDGTTFVGWIVEHDVCSSDRCLVLSNVLQTDKDGNEMPWPKEELLVIPSLSDVIYLRLVPKVEVSSEEPAREQRGTLEGEGANGICEPKPEPASQGVSSLSANAAIIAAGQEAEVTVNRIEKETIYG